MNRRYMFTAFVSAMIAFNVNAQGRFDEMEYGKTKTVFRLNAVSLPKVRIYKDGQGGRPVKTVKMRAIGDDRWEATVKGDLSGMFYTFDIGRGECPGTFAKAVGVNGNRHQSRRLGQRPAPASCIACRPRDLRASHARLLRQSHFGHAASGQVSCLDRASCHRLSEASWCQCHPFPTLVRLRFG